MDINLGHQHNVQHNYPSVNRSLKDKSYDPSVLKNRDFLAGLLMNMWTSFLCICLCTGLTISSSAMCFINFINLIQVDIDLGHKWYHIQHQHNGHQYNERNECNA